jgi:hypothetical protein
MTTPSLPLYSPLRDRYFIIRGFFIDSTVSADLLKLKDRLEAWRATRKYVRQPISDEFRQGAAEMTKRYSLSLVRRKLKLDPGRLKKPSAKKLNREDHRPIHNFFPNVRRPTEGTPLLNSSQRSSGRKFWPP